jgi:hypothetical protein
MVGSSEKREYEEKVETPKKVSCLGAVLPDIFSWPIASMIGGASSL